MAGGVCLALGLAVIALLCLTKAHQTSRKAQLVAEKRPVENKEPAATSEAARKKGDAEIIPGATPHGADAALVSTGDKVSQKQRVLLTTRKLLLELEQEINAHFAGPGAKEPRASRQELVRWSRALYAEALASGSVRTDIQEDVRDNLLQKWQECLANSNAEVDVDLLNVTGIGEKEKKQLSQLIEAGRSEPEPGIGPSWLVTSKDLLARRKRHSDNYVMWLTKSQLRTEAIDLNRKLKFLEERLDANDVVPIQYAEEYLMGLAKNDAVRGDEKKRIEALLKEAGR